MKKQFLVLLVSVLPMWAMASQQSGQCGQQLMQILRSQMINNTVKLKAKGNPNCDVEITFADRDAKTHDVGAFFEFGDEFNYNPNMAVWVQSRSEVTRDQYNDIRCAKSSQGEPDFNYAAVIYQKGYNKGGVPSVEVRSLQIYLKNGQVSQIMGTINTGAPYEKSYQKRRVTCLY